jgi:hypothetical protein
MLRNFFHQIIQFPKRTNHFPEEELNLAEFSTKCAPPQSYGKVILLLSGDKFFLAFY